MAERKIFIVEDEPDIAELLTYNLEREGFEVAACTDGEEAVRRIPGAQPDLVLLDLLLPGLDGLEVCQRLKVEPTTRKIPIIMVTAKGEESDIVLGLGMGADDYISKPFSPKELIARVRAVLRRTSQRGDQDTTQRIEIGPVVIDPQRHEVRVEGHAQAMTATEFRLLYTLAGHPGQVFSRDQLLTRVIGGGAVVIDRNIDVHVRSIRKKLGRHRDLIETVRGVGYRFFDPAA